ncbi:hypothetical protein JOM56_000469, partial [Amanita muscaria]
FVHVPTSRVDLIRFSPAEAHALRDPLGLFCGTLELQQNWREHVVLDPHGWITGPQGHLLMWVPEAKRKHFLTPHITTIIPQPAVSGLDLSSMVHGYMWDRCYDG